MLQTLWLELRPAVLFITRSIPEAVLLDDRVIVIATCPGRIIAIFIDLALPCVTSDVADKTIFVVMARQIRYLLEASDAFTLQVCREVSAMSCCSEIYG